MPVYCYHCAHNVVVNAMPGHDVRLSVPGHPFDGTNGQGAPSWRVAQLKRRGVLR